MKLPYLLAFKQGQSWMIKDIYGSVTQQPYYIKTKKQIIERYPEFIVYFVK